MYDLIIIGGGPAAVAAGIYAARKKLKTLLIADAFGGQSLVSAGIENWIGTKSVSGYDLAQMLEEHLRLYQSVEIKMPEKVISVKEILAADSPSAMLGTGKRLYDFEVATDAGSAYQTKTVILASGARRKRLGIPGEDKFDGKGVAFCATCDAPIFSGKRVAVVGGGNAGLESVVDLFPYASEIFLLHRGEQLKGDAMTQEQIRQNPKAHVILNAEPQEILGDGVVTGMRYKDKKTGAVKELAVDGIFVEIGALPNSEFVKGLVDMNELGEVVINHRTAATSHPGIFAAGDVTDEAFKQNNISAGDAVKAALSAYNYLLGLQTRPTISAPHQAP